MRFTEIESKPQLVKLHYFRVDDIQAAREIGMRQDSKGQWFLPQYDKSGSGFDRKASSAIRLFGAPRTISINR